MNSERCGRCDGRGRVPQLGVGTEPCPDCDDAIPDDEYFDYRVVCGDLVGRNDRSVNTEIGVGKVQDSLEEAASILAEAAETADLYSTESAQDGGHDE